MVVVDIAAQGLGTGAQRCGPVVDPPGEGVGATAKQTFVAAASQPQLHASAREHAGTLVDVLLAEFSLLRHREHFLLCRHDGQATMMNDAAGHLIQDVVRHRSTEGVPEELLAQLVSLLPAEEPTSSAGPEASSEWKPTAVPRQLDFPGDDN